MISHWLIEIHHWLELKVLRLRNSCIKNVVQCTILHQLQISDFNFSISSKVTRQYKDIPGLL